MITKVIATPTTGADEATGHIRLPVFSDDLPVFSGQNGAVEEKGFTPNEGLWI